MVARVQPPARTAGAGLRVRAALRDGPVSRRARLLTAAGRALATALDALEPMEILAWLPEREPTPHGTPSEIQFDVDGRLREPPVHTVYATARLAELPAVTGRRVLDEALATIEAAYPWRATGVLVQIGYGLPYFRRLPAGLLALHLPRLLADTGRYALTEAHGSGQGVPVRVESNDVLLVLRGDDPARLADTLAWLGGSNRLAGDRVTSPRLFTFTSSRATFSQAGLPRKVADRVRAPFASLVHPRARLWTVWGEDPRSTVDPAAATFAGVPGARFTTVQQGDYFDHGAVLHLSHDILDPYRCYDAYDEVPRKRAQIRMAGPGYDAWEVPDGSRRPKLNVAVYAPTAGAHHATATSAAARRQNFLLPPRRHRAFPLLDLG